MANQQNLQLQNSQNTPQAQKFQTQNGFQPPIDPSQRSRVTLNPNQNANMNGNINMNPAGPQMRIMTPEQTMYLRAQLAAFKHLAKNQPVPQDIQSILYNMNAPPPPPPHGLQNQSPSQVPPHPQLQAQTSLPVSSMSPMNVPNNTLFRPQPSVSEPIIPPNFNKIQQPHMPIVNPATKQKQMNRKRQTPQIRNQSLSSISMGSQSPKQGMPIIPQDPNQIPQMVQPGPVNHLDAVSQSEAIYLPPHPPKLLSTIQEKYPTIKTTVSIGDPLVLVDAFSLPSASSTIMNFSDIFERRLVVPGLMPIGTDVEGLRHEREVKIWKDMMNDILDLESSLMEKGINSDDDLYETAKKQWKQERTKRLLENGQSEKENEQDNDQENNPIQEIDHQNKNENKSINENKNEGEHEYDVVSQLVDLKALQLLPKQKALRGYVLSNIWHFSSLITNTYPNFLPLGKKINSRDAMIAETMYQVQNQEHERLKVEQLNKNLGTIQTHYRQVTVNATEKRNKWGKIGKSVITFHSNTEREEQRRLERNAKQRLQALRANDEEAYIKLLDQTKDTRITHLLKQTNQFLGNLTQAVKDQQKYTREQVAAMGHSSADTSAKAEDDSGDEGGQKVDYYAIAHRIQEPVTKQPSILVGGTLKEYQVKGLQWMVSLYNNNLNGILADEMGLGKTIQTLSLITYLIETKKVPGPYLVIVPLSTLTNWTIEFEKWAPSVRKIVYKGPPIQRKQYQARIKAGDFQILLTTYEFIIKDRPLLSKIKWAHMIIDEGHRMKNAQSKLSSTIQQYYHTDYRLILTGTPLQNNLPELWALLNFVLPKIFNSVKSFDEWFNTPFANTGGQDKIDLSEEETLLIIRRLHKVLRPFLLRRLKKDVEKDLPDKVEKVVKCKMSALQSTLYTMAIKYKTLIIGDSGSKHSAAKMGLNNRIMQLRKICNHPFVFEEVEDLVNPTLMTNDDIWRTSGKFELLDRVLPKFKATGHRVLIFFQMTQIMNIMEDFLRLRGMKYLRLDGGTKSDDRTGLLQKFNAPNSEYFCFLLSTRAGGLGLNLQTADTVIIYDTDWNPHQDLQAQDRAHRIGQKNEVRILRLITEESVEEYILERAHQKLDIDGKVIQAGKFDNKSTPEEQEALLRALLEAEEQGTGEKTREDDELDDDELNEILARTDDERKLFKKMDEDMKNHSIYGKGKAKERLFTHDELPEIYKQDPDIVIHETEDTEVYDRRASRKGRVVSYADVLTEEQFLDAIENDEDSLEDAIARKKARIAKLKATKERKAATKSASSTPVPHEMSSPPAPIPAAAESSGDDTPQVGRPKKKRRNREDTVTSGSEAYGEGTPKPKKPKPNPVKRARGRPSLRRGTPTIVSEEQKQMDLKCWDIYNTVISYRNEDNRNLSEIFMVKPNKRHYPDYYLLIQQPIACDAVKRKISAHQYTSVEEIDRDFMLMFKNAMIYNEEGSFVYQDALVLKTLVEHKVNEVLGRKQPDERVMEIRMNDFEKQRGIQTQLADTVNGVPGRRDEDIKLEPPVPDDDVTMDES